MMVLLVGISLIPRIGIQTQKIPPITSVKDKRVSSAAGKFFDPIEYKIKPKHTKVPCSANKPSFLLEDKKFKSFWIKIIIENIQQNNPAIATVVNFGVSFFHLNETEKIENPRADANPYIKPSSDPIEKLSNAILQVLSGEKTVNVDSAYGKVFKNINYDTENRKLEKLYEKILSIS